jgi:hypothetical protein
MANDAPLDDVIEADRRDLYPLPGGGEVEEAAPIGAPHPPYRSQPFRSACLIGHLEREVREGPMQLLYQNDQFVNSGGAVPDILEVVSDVPPEDFFVRNVSSRCCRSVGSGFSADLGFVDPGVAG